MSVAKFKIHDQVKVINYGTKSISTESTRRIYEDFETEAFNKMTDLNTKPDYSSVGKGIKIIDINPEYVGKTIIIDKVSLSGSRASYSATGLNKRARWNEDQLELIYRPNYGK